MRNLKHFASVTALLAVVTGVGTEEAEARDRPGTPTDPRVILAGPTEVDIYFRNTAGSELVVFEIEIELNGKRVDANVERSISQRFGGMYGSGERSGRITSEMLGGQLGPGVEFCFRAWSRTRVRNEGYLPTNNVRSDIPSAWACGVPMPNKPPQPKEVTAKFRTCAMQDEERGYGTPCRPGFDDRTVLVRWLVPEFPFGTTIDRVVIENQRYQPDVTQWEVDFAKEYVIRHAMTYASRDGEFRPPPKQAGMYQYRVCLENASGRECGVSITSLQIENPKIQGVARTPGIKVPEPAAPRTTTPVEELNNPNTMRAQAAATSATASAVESRSRGSGVRVDPSTPVALNPQPLPPKTVILPPRQTTTMSTGSTQLQATASAASRGQIQGTTPSSALAAASRGVVATGAQATPVPRLGGSELICRGGEAPAIGPSYTKAVDGADLLMMYFSPATAAARADGTGLAPAKCGFIDSVAENGAGIVYFKPSDASGEAVRQHLASSSNYWRFRVQKNASGYYEASEHAAWTPAASSNTGAPPNLLQTDDRTVVSLNGQQMTAADAKRLVQSDLRQISGPARPMSIARAAPPALPTANTPLINTPGMFSGGATSIQGVGAGAGRAAALQMDCVSNSPRISNIQGRITPNGRFTINGSCFGTSPGSVRMIGQFDRGNLTPAFAQWTESAIVVEMPALTQLPSHTISVSVQRSGDGKISPAKQAEFSAALHAVDVPSDAWNPTGLFFTHDVAKASGDPFGGYTSFSPNAEQRSTSFRVAVNPSCALETLDVPATIGRVNAVNGWERGAPHEANVEIVWTPACRIYSMNYLVAETHELHCSGAFELKARASCPTGVAPR